MASCSAIEWTDCTWNPTTGCTKISMGCKNCYAERMAARLKAMGNANYANGFELTLQPHMLEKPLEWKKPQMIFVNSMSDLFHKDVPLQYILKVIDVMRRAHWHRFQVLTKRAGRLEEVNATIDWPEKHDSTPRMAPSDRVSCPVQDASASFGPHPHVMRNR